MKNALFAAAAMGVVVEATVSHAKMEWLKHVQGVNVEGLLNNHERVEARANHVRINAVHRANKLRTAHEDRVAGRKTEQVIGQQFDQYGVECLPEGVTVYGDECNYNAGGGFDPFGGDGTKPPDYYENMIYGAIDGLAAGFDPTCANSMYGIVNGGFRAVEYKNIYHPQSTIKFQMAINNFTTSLNSVYTFCDFSGFFKNFAMYMDTSNWEQYIQISSRISGSLIQSVPKYRKCIGQGQAGGNGYDVGICSGGIVSLFLDTKL